MNPLAVAVALHVAGVVWWIGGVAMVTTVVLPLLRRADLPPARREALFDAVERRFSVQARIAVAVVGVSGLYLMQAIDAWAWMGQPAGWWLWAMIGVWCLFAVVLFVAEPILERRASPRPDADTRLARLHRRHLWVLAASIVTVLGAAMGAHGGW